MSRISVPEYFLDIALVVAQRSTCVRRSVGCVLIDKWNHVLATGYNGVASGLPHCIDQPCPGAMALSGTNLHLCEAIHAEENALIQCKDIKQIDVCYSTTAPCIHCVRRLLNTSCQRIVFLQEYPHTEAKALWESQNRTWTKYS